MGKSFFSDPCKSGQSVVHSLLFPGDAQGLRTDDVLWPGWNRDEKPPGFGVNARIWGPGFGVNARIWGQLMTFDLIASSRAVAW
jgi:hypothetical protein